jgi:hypothetical protein
VRRFCKIVAILFITLSSLLAFAVAYSWWENRSSCEVLRYYWAPSGRPDDRREVGLFTWSGDLELEFSEFRARSSQVASRPLGLHAVLTARDSPDEVRWYRERIAKDVLWKRLSMELRYGSFARPHEAYIAELTDGGEIVHVFYYGGGCYSFSMPHGLAFALLSAPAICWIFWRGRRRRRIAMRQGYCRKCNYDLRASTDKCPECGTAIPPRDPESPPPAPTSSP